MVQTKSKTKRPNWDEYFFALAEVVKRRSNCIRRDVGAVIVKDKRIISTGYNGTPHGIPNCDEGGCPRCHDRQSGKLESGQKEEQCICIHAEQNAIIQSAYLGVSTKGATMYSTTAPCNQCAKMIINSGIVRIVCETDSHYPDGVKLLRLAKIKVED